MRKNNRFEMRKLVMALIFSLILVGCTSVQISKNFVDPQLPKDDHCVLTFDDNLIDVYIDDVVDLGISGTGGQYGTYSKTGVAILTPGKHTISARFQDTKRVSSETSSFWGNYETTTTKTTTTTTASEGWITVLVSFTTGHTYQAYPSVEDGSFTIEVVDVTSAAALGNETAIKLEGSAKRWLASVKFPKTAPAPVQYNKAVEAAPTKFEGTWGMTVADPKTLEGQWLTFKVTFTPPEYTFTGSSYQLNQLRKIGDEQIPQLLSAMYAANPSISSEQAGEYIYQMVSGIPLGQRGTFTFTDDTITFLPCLVPFSHGWIMAAPVTLTYKYSFTPEGNILLTAKGIKGMADGTLIGTLIKK
jgi:hypothetical protein